MFGQVMSSHHCYQMSQRSQVSADARCWSRDADRMEIQKYHQSINQSMFICRQQPIGFSKRQRLLTEPPFYISYTWLSTKQNITESALGILAEATQITIARSWTQFQVNQHQLITTRQIEMAFKSNLVFLVDMHRLGLNERMPHFPHPLSECLRHTHRQHFGHDLDR